MVEGWSGTRNNLGICPHDPLLKDSDAAYGLRSSYRISADAVGRRLNLDCGGLAKQTGCAGRYLHSFKELLDIILGSHIVQNAVQTF